jgi:hypothetical protein
MVLVAAHEREGIYLHRVETVAIDKLSKESVAIIAKSYT